MRIVVSADASPEGAAAREWCVQHLHPADDITVVVGVDQFSEAMLSMSPLTATVDVTHLRDEVRREFEQAFAVPGLRASIRLENHSQSRAVIDVARAQHADLIVVGKRPHHGLTDMILNETAGHLVHQPPCPVVVVPTTMIPDRTPEPAHR